MASVLKQEPDVSISDSFYSAILQNKSIIDSDCNDMGALVDVSIPPLMPSAYTVPKPDKIAASSLANFPKLEYACAAGFALLNLPKGKSLGRSKPATNSSNEQAH
jgi:hypothetical protein